MADNINSRDIDDIVSGVRAALSSGEGLGGVRFEFVEEDEEAVSLVFDDEDSLEETVTEADPIVVEAEEPVVTVPEKKEEKEKPFSVSEEKIWTTYVPRFTGASDRYTMRKKEETASAQPAYEAKSVRDIPIFTPTAQEKAIDPTAEIDSEDSIVGATVITPGNVVDDSADKSTVFKFDGEDATEEIQVTSDEVDEIIDEPLVLSNDEQEEPDDSGEEESDIDKETPEEEESAPIEEAPVPAPISISEKMSLTAERSAITLESVDENVGKKKNREYNAISEKDYFIDSFVDSITAIRVRMCCAAVLAVLLLFIENAAYLGINLVRFMHLEGVGAAMAVITLPFIAGLFLLMLPEVVRSFTSLTVGKLTSEFFITVSFAVLAFYYGIVIAFSSHNDYLLLGSPFAAIAIFVMLSTYCKRKAEFMAFKLISRNGEKLVVDRKLTRNLPAEHRALDGIVESYKSRTARVFRTSFVSDFSARSSVISESSVKNLIILAISFGIALVGGVFAFFIPGGIVVAARTLALTYMLALPSFIFISHKILFSEATSAAIREKSAFIGEKSLFEYSGVDVVTFDDTEIFTRDDVNLQRIMVYGKKENLPKALQQMSSLFTVVGGPLAYIFADAVDRKVVPADNVAVDVDGIVGMIEGVEVAAGNAAFMERHGITIPYDPSGEGTTSQSTRIMYASEGGEIYAKFYVRYMLSEDFTMILPLILDEKIKPLVYTRDPNVDDALFHSLTAGKDSIRVLKKQSLPSSEVRLYSRVSLGMVSIGEKTDIINSILLSKKYASLHERLSLAEPPLVVGGAVLGLLLSLLVKAAIPSIFLSLWYVGWSIGVIAMGKRLFGVKKEKNKDKEE